MKPKKSFISGRLFSIQNAFRGALLILRTETSFQVQVVVAILLTIAGFVYHISAMEWTVQLLTIALVMGLEAANTAIEDLANFIHPEHHIKIGGIKDLAAGAVFIAVIFALIIGAIIYFPKVF